jgi:molybdopterin molybdotransferase
MAVSVISANNAIFRFARLPSIVNFIEKEPMTTPYQEALQIILKAIPAPDSSMIPVKKSLGRVLAEELKITRDFPDLRLSAIDGYAFSIDRVTEYWKVGDVGAGSMPDFALQPGQCAAVMTGAPVPNGTDCVVRVEDCIETSGYVKAEVPLQPGDLINETASEAATGKPLMPAGSQLNKSIYPTLFYAGIPAVKVFNPPKIGMLLTGDELCDVDETPAKGQVFNTNCYILESFLNAIHVEITTQLQVKDDETAIKAALDMLADTCDIVVSSGGVSMGRYDYIKKNFNNGDFNLLIQGTGIKPGRPLMVAEKRGKLFFGMPGYPAAFLTNCLVYLIPALKKACGRSDYSNRFITATLTAPMKSKKGRLYLNRVNLELGVEGWIARTPGSQKTSHFLNFADVNGLAFLSEEVGDLEPGAKIKCLHFDLELC